MIATSALILVVLTAQSTTRREGPTPVPRMAKKELTGDIWRRPRYVVFGASHSASGWVTLEVHTRAVRHLSPGSQFDMKSVAVNPAGDVIAFTAFDPPTENTLLFLWRPESGERPTRVGDVKGYHDEPSFSPDGQWIYFTHNPDARGPARQHSMQAYAQIYRVHLDGTGLEWVTSSRGCKLSPAPISNALFFIHTQCRGEAARPVLEWRTGSKEPTVLGMNFGPVLSVAPAPDGTSMLLNRPHGNNFEVTEFRISSGRERPLFSGLGDGAHQHVQYGSTQSEVFYEDMGSVRVFDGATSSVIQNLGEHL